MSVVTRYNFGLLTTETLTSGIVGASNPKVVFDAYEESGTLNASSTVPATKSCYMLGALTAGAQTINLAALTGANGTVDFTGLRVQLIRVKNLGANAMTFAEGASNGIALACLPFIVPAGGIAQFYLADLAPDVASGDRTIDVSGTLAQTFEFSIVAG
jgi:hypothetical protein